MILRIVNGQARAQKDIDSIPVLPKDFLATPDRRLSEIFTQCGTDVGPYSRKMGPINLWYRPLIRSISKVH